MSSEGLQSEDGSRSGGTIVASTRGKAREYKRLESYEDEAEFKVRFETEGWYVKVFWHSLVYLN